MRPLSRRHKPPIGPIYRRQPVILFFRQVAVSRFLSSVNRLVTQECQHPLTGQRAPPISGGA